MISNKVFTALAGRANIVGRFALPAAQAQRTFAKKGKKSAGEMSEPEEHVAEPVAEPEEHVAEPVVAAPVKKAEPVRATPKSFYDLGDINVLQTTPNHKPPILDDTVQGRYAGVLFTTASQQNALYDIYEDMMYINDLYKESENFRMFTTNQGVGKKQIAQLNECLLATAPFHKTTLHFLTVLAENKRLDCIYDIGVKYKKLYQLFNKEEKITIISAEDLTKGQKADVLAALQANPNNVGKEFTIEYTVDAAIQGGLQMYTESEFMDMSLVSRMTRINEEVFKLTA